jgi:hypothetical protein
MPRELQKKMLRLAEQNGHTVQGEIRRVLRAHVEREAPAGVVART